MAEPGTRAWLTAAGLAAAGALAAETVPAAWIDWQPALAWHDLWRWWTAAFVHWSPMHLAANLAGCAVVAAFGARAGLPRAATVAWMSSWPLTHGALLAQPALAHYGGLSGVLHAGTAVVAAWLIWRGRRGARGVGAAVAAGLMIKVLLERPWAGPLVHPQGWDIAVAPLAHAAGTLAGAMLGSVAAWLAPVGSPQRN